MGEDYSRRKPKFIDHIISTNRHEISNNREISLDINHLQNDSNSKSLATGGLTDRSEDIPETKRESKNEKRTQSIGAHSRSRSKQMQSNYFGVKSQTLLLGTDLNKSGALKQSESLENTQKTSQVAKLNYSTNV
jgi:hypothetical protein